MNDDWQFDTQLFELDEDHPNEEDVEDIMFGLSPKRKQRKGARLNFMPKSKPRIKPPRSSTASTTLSAEAEDKLQLANNQYIEGEYEQSLETLKDVIRLAPGAHDPFHLMGLIHETAFKNYKKAINSYLIAAQLLKNDSATWAKIAQLAVSIKQPDLAIYCYRRVVPGKRVLGEIDEIACYDLSQLLLMRLDFRRASLYLLKLVMARPFDVYLVNQFVSASNAYGSTLASATVLRCCTLAMIEPEIRSALGFRLGFVFFPRCNNDILSTPNTVGIATLKAHLPAAKIDQSEHLPADWKTVEHFLTSAAITETDSDASVISTAVICSECGVSAVTDTTVPIVLNLIRSLPLICIARYLTVIVRSLSDVERNPYNVHESVADMGNKELKLDTGFPSACNDGEIPWEHIESEYSIKQDSLSSRDYLTGQGDPLTLALADSYEQYPEAAQHSADVSAEEFVTCADHCRNLSLLTADVDAYWREVYAILIEKLAYLDGSTDSRMFKTLGTLADGFMYSCKPNEALAIYECVSSMPGLVHNKNEFWLQAAKCYIQLKSFDKATDLLKLLAPMNDAGSTRTLMDQVRSAEAQLLLWKVISRDDDADILQGLQSGDHINEIASSVTFDNRIKLLMTGSSLSNVPRSCISGDNRKLICMLLVTYDSQLSSLRENVVCYLQMSDWLKSANVDGLAHPQIPVEIIDKLLPSNLKAIAAEIVTGNISITALWLAIQNTFGSIDTSPSYAHVFGCTIFSDTGPNNRFSVCVKCRTQACQGKIATFLHVWRVLMISLYVVLIRDGCLDMRRVLGESSRQRATLLTEHLRNSSLTTVQPLDSDGSDMELDLGEFNIGAGDPMVSTIEGSHEEFASPTDTLSMNDGDEEYKCLSSGSDEDEDIIVETRPRWIDAEYQRKRDRLARGIVAHQVIQHKPLKHQLGLESLEQFLTWDEYINLIHLGSLLLCEIGSAEIAIELIENVLLSIRYCRSHKTLENAESQVNFKMTLKRLVLRIALAYKISKVSLVSIRKTYVNTARRDTIASPSLCMYRYELLLAYYFNELFSTIRDECAICAFNASSNRQILAFNRSWSIRRLCEFPSNAILLAVTGHFCIITQRYSYALNEYRRGLSKFPNSSILSLCLCASMFQYSMSRRVNDRHQLVVQGFLSLERYKKIRFAHADTVISRIQSFVLQYVNNVVNLGLTSSRREVFLRKLFALTKLSAAANIIDVITTELHSWLEANFTYMKSYFECENRFNSARAAHGLGLYQIAARQYLNVIETMQAAQHLIDPLTQCVQSQMREMGGIAKKSLPAISIVSMLAKTPFPPALFDESDCWYGPVRSPCMTRGNLIDFLLTCQVRTDACKKFDDMELLISPKHQSSAIAAGTSYKLTIVANNEQASARKGDDAALRGLFNRLQFIDDADTRRISCQIVEEYISNTLPYSSILAFDGRHLLKSSIFNLAKISQAHCIPYVQHQNMCGTIIWQ